MTENTTNNNKDFAHKKRSLFGRRQGRSLGGERTHVINDLLPKLTPNRNLLNEDSAHPPASYFDIDHSNYILEIGFGHGERLAQHAQQEQTTGFLGAEPFVNGMAAFLKNIDGKPNNNIRVIMDDGMIIAKSLKPETLDAIYILNPDPWHKTRHHKRRLINQETLDIFAKILKSGGKLIMTSDVPNLAEWMCTHANNHPSFQWTAESRANWETPPQNWIKTKYEIKGAKGAKKMSYLVYERN
ncbi:MAG: tRNA (guanosine(46)-N7)-methyltransferase TrmB [Alphaproteobacteria bacterium]